MEKSCRWPSHRGKLCETPNCSKGFWWIVYGIIDIDFILPLIYDKFRFVLPLIYDKHNTILPLIYDKKREKNLHNSLLYCIFAGKISGVYGHVSRGHCHKDMVGQLFYWHCQNALGQAIPPCQYPLLSYRVYKRDIREFIKLSIWISEWSSTWWVNDHSCDDWKHVLAVSIFVFAPPS